VDDDLDIEELNNLEAGHLKELIARIYMLRRKISLDFIESLPAQKV
jgi:hypothetical protein